MFNDYPDAWAVTLATREQRDNIAKAGGQCQLQFAGCTTRAVATSATLPHDPVRDHRPACQPCAANRAVRR